MSDLGLHIGLLPSGPTGSVHDVPGFGVGHATVWRDEPDPPAGRGVARTGVTVLDPGGSAYREPVPAGAAVLNGAGECTGLWQVREWGLLETPVFLTSTMQVGRVYDAAVSLLTAEEPAVGLDDVLIPVVAECDDSFLSDARRVQVEHSDVATALGAARAAAGGPAPVQGAVGAGTGMTCFGWKGGIGTASRVTPDGSTVGALVLANFGDPPRLTVAGVPVGLHVLPPDGSHPRAPAGSCIVVLVTDAALDASGCERFARRAALGLARTGSIAHHGSGEITLALASGLRAPRGEPAPRPALSGSGLDPVFAAAVEATEEAVLASLLAATGVAGRAGRTSHALPVERLTALLRGREP